MTYLAAPPPPSYPLSLWPRLGPYLIVCLFSLAAGYFRSQAKRREVGAYDIDFPPPKAEGQQQFLVSVGPAGNT